MINYSFTKRYISFFLLKQKRYSISFGNKWCIFILIKKWCTFEFHCYLWMIYEPSDLTQDKSIFRTWLLVLILYFYFIGGGYIIYYVHLCLWSSLTLNVILFDNVIHQYSNMQSQGIQSIFFHAYSIWYELFSYELPLRSWPMETYFWSH